MSKLGTLVLEETNEKNILGAILTDPASPDGDIGMLFLSPHQPIG